MTGMPYSGPTKPDFLERGVELRRLLHGERVDGDERIDARAFLVIGVDTLEIHLDEFAGGERSALVGGVDIRDGCFLNFELARR